MAMLKVTEDTHEDCWMEIIFFPLLIKVESKKEKSKSVSSADTISALHALPSGSLLL